MTEPLPPLPTLPMQLMLNLGCWLSSPFALACAKNAWPPSSSNSPNGSLREALAEETKNRATSFLIGILRYLDTSYQREISEPPCIWKRGHARLLDYGMRTLSRRESRPNPLPAGEGKIALFIPSLINRYYILDLQEERSLLRYMASQGIYPLVMDWGAPGEFEKGFSCGDYITNILHEAIDFITQASQERIILAGYCMGGNLALAAAQLKPTQVSALALLATPWDFHCKSFSSFVLDKPWLPLIEEFIAAQQNLPADIIQSLFYLTDPWVFEQKFRRFANLPPESRAAKDFIALEHWVNDGVPMTANVARDCLIGWAQENRMCVEQWTVGGKAITPHKVKQPVFIAMPLGDHVVPFDCAKPLADALPQATIVNPSTGHVGMIVGHKAKKELWQKLAEWVKHIIADS